jgi:tRNA(fMet)-specific endonuclease VapC
VKYVLDTSTVSFLMRGDPSVASRIQAKDRSEVRIAQPAIAEIEYGLSRLPSSARRRKLRRAFDVVLAEIDRAEWTDVVSQAFGEIKADLERRGLRLGDFDVAMAAHARALEATLVTDNVSDLKRVRGISIENWRTPDRPDSA